MRVLMREELKLVSGGQSDPPKQQDQQKKDPNKTTVKGANGSEFLIERLGNNLFGVTQTKGSLSNFGSNQVVGSIQGGSFNVAGGGNLIGGSGASGFSGSSNLFLGFTFSPFASNDGDNIPDSIESAFGRITGIA